MTSLPRHHFAVATFVVIIASLSIANVFLYYKNKTTVTTTVSLEDELNYWKRVVHTYPDYRDGYLEIAKIELALGNINEAKNSLIIARGANPNSEKIKNIENILGVSTKTP